MKTFEQKEYMKAWLNKMTTLFPYSFFSYRCSPLSEMHIVVVQPEKLLTNERFENEMIDLFDSFEFKYHAEVLCISPDDESYALLTDGGKWNIPLFLFWKRQKEVIILRRTITCI
jgi:hypothetical protein